MAGAAPPAGLQLADRELPPGQDLPERTDRRWFLIAGAGAAALAAVSGGLGDALLGRFSVASSRAQVRLPAPAVSVPAGPAGTELGISGLTPFFTPNASFYRVDTDLVLPQVAPQTWTLRVDGLVGREIQITFADLLKMPLTEADITLVCVSNQVGGPYAGSARWLGAPLARPAAPGRGAGGRGPGAVHRRRRDDHLHAGCGDHGRRYTPAQLASGTPIKTLEGGTVTPGKMADGTYTINGASVVCGDVQTANATV